MRSWSRGAPSARSCSRASAAEGRGGRAFGKCRSETAILGGNSTFRQVLPTMSFDTPFALCGPFRQPRQMLAEQEYGGYASVHDVAMAVRLGFRAGPVGHPAHFSIFMTLPALLSG